MHFQGFEYDVITSLNHLLQIGLQKQSIRHLMILKKSEVPEEKHPDSPCYIMVKVEYSKDEPG